MLRLLVSVFSLLLTLQRIIRLHFFFLKTISSRTLPTESINNENLKGRLLHSGDAYLVRDGKEYYDLMPVWDWNLLPGVTVFPGAAAAARLPWVGGVSNGMSGAAVMDYQLTDEKGGSLTAKKPGFATTNG
jgi:Polysaccharide lyase family 8, super-sandwich domain.